MSIKKISLKMSGEETELDRTVVDQIGDPITKKMRQLDKLVDELAKGKPMEKVLR